MYKLNGHGLGRGEWFMPETQPLTLAGKDSTSTITLGPNAPEIGFNDWLLQDDGPEGAIVWRVKNIDDQTDAETVTVELEHVINCLDDPKLFTEATTKAMAGNSSATTVTAKKAVQYLLGLQNDWVLGEFEFNDSNPYEFDGDSILDALCEIRDSLEDCVLDFDMTQYPFRIHFRQQDNTVLCEMRGERNLTTLRRSFSRSGMYTRFYPVGKNDLHIDGEYVSENEGLYGRIDKIETDQSKTTKANLLSWAYGQLRRHSQPTVTISISGLELSEDTGEDLDHLKMNKMCRVPLPEYSTTITEPIIKKAWSDWIKDRQKVTVTLSNAVDDVTSIIKSESKKSGKAKKGNAKQNYLFEANGEHLYYEVFDDCGHLHSVLEMTEESLRIAFDNTIASTRSEFMMTSESLRIKFENDISSTRSEFQMTSESLRIKFENDISSTRSEFQMTSESLRIKFENDISSTRSEFQMTSESLRISFENTASSLRSDIQVEAGRIGLLVEGSGTSASIKLSAIVDGLNESQLELNADRVVIGSGSSKKKVKVYVDGKITATEGQITNLTTGTTKATLINAYNFTGDTVSGGTVYATTSLTIGSGTQGGSGTLYYRGSQYYRQGVTMGPATGYFIEGHFLGDSSTTLNMNHYHKITAEEGTGANAGKIIITLSDPVATSDSSDHVTNFKIADTTAYKNGVLSARNNVKVKAFTADARQGTLNDHRTFTYTTDAPTPASGTSQADTWYLAGGTSWGSNKTTVYLRYGSSGGTAYAQLQVDASSVYTSGNRAGRAAVTLNDPTWNAISGDVGTSRTVSVSTSGRTNSSGTTENLTKSVALFLTGSGLTVSMRAGSESGTVYAKKTLSDSNLTAGNIKKNVTIFGVTGSYEASGGTPASSVALIKLDEGHNRWNNYYTAVLYDSGSNEIRTIPGGNGQGLYFPLSEGQEITTNGSYTAPTGYVGYRSFTVNVSSGGGSVTIDATVVGSQTARAGQTAVNAFTDGAVRIFSAYTLSKDGSYDMYYKFKVTAGGATKYYYFKV